MSTTMENRAGEEPDDRVIDALLGRDMPNSIVDSLFALPETDTDHATALERAAVSRLQQVLARKMRALLEDDSRDAA